MKEDFLHEGDLFQKENARQLQTSFYWLLILLIAGFADGIFYLTMRIIYDNDFYKTAKPEDFERMNMIYKLFAGFFATANLTLYTIAAVKVNQTIGRFFVILIGVFHILSYVYYQFFA